MSKNNINLSMGKLKSFLPKPEVKTIQSQSILNQINQNKQYENIEQFYEKIIAEKDKVIQYLHKKVETQRINCQNIQKQLTKQLKQKKNRDQLLKKIIKEKTNLQNILNGLKTKINFQNDILLNQKYTQNTQPFYTQRKNSMKLNKFTHKNNNSEHIQNFTQLPINDQILQKITMRHQKSQSYSFSPNKYTSRYKNKQDKRSNDMVQMIFNLANEQKKKSENLSIQAKKIKQKQQEQDRIQTNIFLKQMPYLKATFKNVQTIKQNYTKHTEQEIQNSNKYCNADFTQKGLRLNHNGFQINMKAFVNQYWANVQFLNISNCKIQDIRWNRLVQHADQFPHLKWIWIHNNKIVTVLIQHLQKFKKLKGIHFTSGELNNPLSLQSKGNLLFFKQKFPSIQVWY